MSSLDFGGGPVSLASMIDQTIIPPVSKEACDEFGRYLAELRMVQAVSARALSQKLGLNETYVYQLERKPTRVTVDTLETLSEALELDYYEKGQLFRLAISRNAPWAGDLTASDPQESLLHSLLDVEHGWRTKSDEINARYGRAAPLVDAVAWLLAKLAVFGADTGQKPAIHWPEETYRAIAADRPRFRKGALVIHDDDLRREWPDFDATEGFPGAEQAWRYSMAMARAFRRALLTDVERLERLVRLIRYWSFDRTPELFDCVTVVLDGEHVRPEHDLLDVHYQVACEADMSFVARTLWHGKRMNVMHDNAFVVVSRDDREHVIDFVHADPSRWFFYADGQRFRDAYYGVRWGPHFHQPKLMLFNQKGYKSRAKAFERQLRSGRVDDEMRHKVMFDQSFFAAVNKDEVVTYAASLEGRLQSMPNSRKHPDDPGRPHRRFAGYKRHDAAQ